MQISNIICFMINNSYVITFNKISLSQLSILLLETDKRLRKKFQKILTKKHKKIVASYIFTKTVFHKNTETWKFFVLNSLY